jgi:SAM-dependent methyltransferase
MFDAAYEGTPPWEIGKPQPAFTRLAAQGLKGRLLDAGCGTGENALLFAAHGLDVTGVDSAPRAIARAQAKAHERGIKATFLVHDALRLGELGGPFDHAIDCGLFHTFSDADRVRYARSLGQAVRSGGSAHILCMRDTGKDWGFGPRRVRPEEIHTTFRSGWRVNAIEASQFEVVDLDRAFGAAWFVALERA